MRWRLEKLILWKESCKVLPFNSLCGLPFSNTSPKMRAQVLLELGDSPCELHFSNTDLATPTDWIAFWHPFTLFWPQP
jgi:hypothetical protein